MGVSTSWESRKEVVRSIVRGCCISSERITTVGRWRLKIYTIMGEAVRGAAQL